MHRDANCTVAYVWMKIISFRILSLIKTRRTKTLNKQLLTVPIKVFPIGGIFLAQWNFLLLNDQSEYSGRQKTKEIIVPAENSA